MRIPTPLALLLALGAGTVGAPAAAEPSGFPTHQIVREDSSRFGRTVDVLLTAPIAEPALTVLVRSLAAGTPDGRPTLVNVYLPGMKIGAAPFASGSHQAGVPVDVSGGAPDAAQGQAASSAGAGRQDGRPRIWDMTWPEPSGRLTISRFGTRFRAEWLRSSGERKTEDLAQAPTLRGTRLDALSPASEQHYILRPDGTLEVHGPAGLIARGVAVTDAPLPPATAAGAQPMQPAPPRPARAAAGAALTAVSVSIVEPWPRTQTSRLALARTVLTETPSKPVMPAPQPVFRPAGAQPPRTATKSQNASSQSQAQVWKDLSRFFQPVE